jgi:hypothetical protein
MRRIALASAVAVGLSLMEVRAEEWSSAPTVLNALTSVSPVHTWHTSVAPAGCASLGCAHKCSEGYRVAIDGAQITLTPTTASGPWLIKKAFSSIDTDSSGAIDSQEIVALEGMIGCGLMGVMGEGLSQSEVQEVMLDLDADGSGTVEFEEFSPAACECRQATGLVDAATPNSVTGSFHDGTAFSFTINALTIPAADVGTIDPDEYVTLTLGDYGQCQATYRTGWYTPGVPSKASHASRTGIAVALISVVLSML